MIVEIEHFFYWSEFSLKYQSTKKYTLKRRKEPKKTQIIFFYCILLYDEVLVTNARLAFKKLL